MAVPGDIAIVGFSADLVAGVGGKSFAFVILADLGGQTISFTDNGWFAAGGFRSGEGVVTYTVPVGTPIGTVVTISNLTASVNPSAAGDQILAYLGSASSPTFLFAVDFADSNTMFAGDATNANTSAVPTGLTLGSTALAFGGDNGAYVGPLTGSRAELLAAIANPDNWTQSDTTPPPYPASFTISGGGAVQVSINDVSLAEGDSGSQILTFTVTRSANSGSFSIDFATSDGSATAGSDYTGTSGTISFAAGGDLSQTISVTITGDTVVEGNETLVVTLSNLINSSGTAVISDASGTGTITNDDIIIVPIHDIQGAAHVSPLVGTVVSTRGIVTAVDTNGFYIQTPDAEIDADDRTSQGLFVFTSSAPTVVAGDLLVVTGTVAEFTPSGTGSGNLSTTQLTGPVISRISQGNALPSAIIMGAGGRPAPTEIIDDDNFATFDPASDGIDYYESLEGMRVTVPSPLVVAPTTENGEIFTVADNGAGATGLSSRGALVTKGSVGDGLNVTNTGPGADYNPERIQIDGDSFTPGGAANIPSVPTGTRLNDVTGIVSYGFGNYEVLATSAVTVANASLLTDDVTTLTGSATVLTIASYNTLNLDPGDPAAKFTNLALDIVNGLGSPDIIALQEIQDNSGATNNGVVAANITLQMLVDAIAANGGPTYSFIDNPFITNNTSGGEPGGNIRVAYLYNPARVSLVEGSLATTPDAATDFAGSRLPLIATFSFNGDEVTLINNHFTSKGGSSALFGSQQPSVNGGAADRLVQAQNVADYVASLGSGAKVVVLGDMNDFSNEESLAPLSAAGLQNLSDTLLTPSERYSYNFEGNAQELDQAYVSEALGGIVSFDIVHRNSERPATATSPSDHDPMVIALDFTPPPVPFGQPGDIAFVGFNADGNDDLAFVALKAIPAGTTIYFNDQEWQGSAFNTGEGQIAWTAGADIAAGTVVTISTIATTPASSHGTVTGSTGLGGDAEIVYAYIGAAFAPTGFLAAIANDGFAQSGGTLDGTGLVVGQTAIDLSNSGANPGEDVAAFNAARFGAASFAAYLPIINNPANWQTQDGTGDQSADGTLPDLPFDTTGFIVGGVETQLVRFQPTSLSVAEGTGGTTTISFTLVRTGGTTGAVEVTGSFAAGTTNATDFGGSLPSGFAATIAAGQQTATVTISIAADAQVEADESFSLTITGVSNSAGIATSINSGSATATATISNDDVPPPAFGPGDIAFVGFNADGSDDLAFVALKPLPAGTVIRFTDNEWQGSAFNSGEGDLAWTATAAIAPGTVVTISSLSSSPTSALGSVAVTGSLNLGASDEMLYAYIGNAGSPSAFLAAIANDGFAVSGGTLNGTGLVVGQTAINLGAISAGEDIGAFNAARNSASNFGAYAAIINTASNWITQDGTGDQSADANQPNVPFSTTPFTLSGALVTVDGIAIGSAPASLAGSATTPVASDDLAVVRLGAIRASVAGAESIAYADGTIYTSALAANAVNIHRINADGSLSNEAPISLVGLPGYGSGGVNAVDVANGVLAVAYENADPALPGRIALFDTATRTLIKTIEVGVLPDDVTFTPDGSKLIVANEAEALAANGSVSIIDLSGGAASASVITTIGFENLNGYEALLRARGVAVAPGQSAAGDIEPEYVTVSADGTRAFVTLQEVNAVAVIDLTNPAATKPLAVLPLGSIDYNLPGNAIDVSDQDGGINIRNVPVRGLLQPDAIASFQVGGVTYFATANEGDARVNVADTVRLGSSSYVLDPTAFPNAAAMKANAELGRLNVLTTVGDTDGDGDFDVIHTLGGRGLSIFRVEADGSITKVRETGGEFEAIIAANHPASFNSNQSVNASSRDTRSDDKGPEPESVSIGQIGDRLYAFVGLERVGGQMVYDITDPANAFFVAYRPQTADDLGPETSIFVSAANSPTGQALLISANEISNSVTLYSLQSQTEGDDVLAGSAGDDRLSGKGGNDRIDAGAGNDLVNGGTGNDWLIGGDGLDTLSFEGIGNGVVINLGVERQVANGDAGQDRISGFENLVGTGFGDHLLGSTGDNRIDGGAGDDLVHGARGNDVIVGGGGSDLLFGGVGADSFRFDRLDNGAGDVIGDFQIRSGDRLILGQGITITSVAVAFEAATGEMNGETLRNSSRALDLIITVSDAGGASQTIRLIDAYQSGTNSLWEAELGIDLTYPGPIIGPEPVLIG